MEDLNFNPGFTQSCGGNGNKRKSTGIDLNKKPQQRQRRYKPKIFDALKPKKSPKTPDTKKFPKKQNRKKRREACLSEQISDLNPENRSPNVSETTKQREACLSEHISELNPKIPSSDVELCPTTPRPKIFSQSYERRKYGSRRTLEFKSENSIQEEGGGKLGIIGVERQDGDGNIEVERPQGGGKVGFIEDERQEGGGKVGKIEVERPSNFNTFTSSLELPPEEDFDDCMKKVVEEYRNEILYAQWSLAEC